MKEENESPLSEIKSIKEITTVELVSQNPYTTNLQEIDLFYWKTLA